MILTERLRLVLSLYPWVWGHEMVDWISSWFEIRTRKYRIRLLRLLAVLFRILPGGEDLGELFHNSSQIMTRPNSLSFEASES